MAQFVVTGITLAGRASIQLHVHASSCGMPIGCVAIASPQDSIFAADIARVG
jgi:hypothetical protein